MPGTGHSHRYKGSISNRNTKPAFQVLAPWNARKNGEQNQVAVSTGGTNLKFAKMGAKMMSNYNAVTDIFAFNCEISTPGGGGGGSVWLPASSGRIYYESGNVGIGIINPSATLHVEGTVQMGYQTTASGDSSTAMGQFTTASGGVSTAMGYQTTASGDYSTAMGQGTTASGDYSTAIGTYSTADATGTGSSIAIGNKAYAGDDINFAIGVGSSSDAATALLNNNKFVILQNGNVGIGANIQTPLNILDVSGATSGAVGLGIAINGTKVIGPRGASIASIGGGSTEADAINLIIGALRTHGLIAT